MEREMQNKPCSRVLISILAIGIAVSAFAFASPRSAYADDAELSQLQAQIESTADDYDKATARVAELQQQIQDNQNRIDEISGQLPAQQERSSDAVKALYLLQQEGYNMFQMILGSENIGDFLQRLDYVDCIQQHNVAQLQKLNNMKTELEDSQANLNEAEKQADLEADRASRALDQAKTARQEAQDRAVAEAAAQAAAAQAAAAQGTTAATSSSGGGVDSQNTASSVPADNAGGGVSGSVSADDVNWSSDKTAFVAEWTGRIDNYLSGSPLSGYGRLFAESAWDYGVDPRWSPAISCIESGKGAVCFRSCNAWGWMGQSFGSWDEAVPAHVSYLARVYGGTLTYAAAAKYCPPGDSWYNAVLAQMNSI